MADNNKLATLYVEIKAKSEELDEQLKKVKEDLDGIKTKSKSSFNIGSFLVATGVVTGLTAVLKKSVSEFSAQQDAQKRLSTQLGYTNEALLEQASALQKISIYGDDVIINAQATIAAFTKNTDEIKLLTAATTDLASGLGIDLEQAAQLLAKTFGSSTNALSRYGLEVTGAAGSTERLTQITNGIAELWGGQASAAAETFSGKIAQLQNKIGDFLENIGGPLATTLGLWIDKLSELIPETNDSGKEFDELAYSVINLNNNILPLLNEYDKLKSKSRLSSVEQERMRLIINTVASTIPSAVTEFNNLGQAIGISTLKAREFISAQKVLLQLKNADQIQLLSEKIQLYERKLTTANKVIDNYNNKENKTAEDIKLFKDASTNAAKYTVELLNLKNALSQLNGNDLEAYLKALEESSKNGSGGNNGGDNTNKTLENINEVDKKIKDIIKSQKEINEQINIINEAIETKTLKVRNEEGRVVESIVLSEKDINKLMVERIKLSKLLAELQRPSDLFDVEAKPLEYPNNIGNQNYTITGTVEQPERPLGPVLDDMDALNISSTTFTDSITEGAIDAVLTLGYEIGNAVKPFEQANSLLQKFINGLVQATIQALALKAAMAFLNFITGGIGGAASALVGHSGGTFVNGNKTPAFAGGGSFIVPQGFPNDSFPMLVESGERVTITPRSAVNTSSKNTDALLNELINSVRANTLTVAKTREVNLGDIYLDGEKVSKKVKGVENKLSKNGVKLDALR